MEWTDINVRRKDKCLKITGIPTDKTLKIDNIEQIVCDYNRIPPDIKKRIKIIKTEKFDGSLDGRARGIGGEIIR